MTDTNGDSLGTIKYYPYGGTRSCDIHTDKKFTGQRLDDIGLYYYGARYYDPEIDRYNPSLVLAYRVADALHSTIEEVFTIEDD